MRESIQPTRKEFLEAHEGYEFRKFTCTGSCGTVIEALANAELWCNQPGCRGTMKHSYPVSAARLAKQQYQDAKRRSETPRSTPPNFEVFGSQSPQSQVGQPITPGPMNEGLIGGIHHLQQMVIASVNPDTDMTWILAPKATNPDK